MRERERGGRITTLLDEFVCSLKAFSRFIVRFQILPRGIWRKRDGNNNKLFVVSSQNKCYLCIVIVRKLWYLVICINCTHTVDVVGKARDEIHVHISYTSSSSSSFPFMPLPWHIVQREPPTPPPLIPYLCCKELTVFTMKCNR